MFLSPVPSPVDLFSRENHDSFSAQQCPAGPPPCPQLPSWQDAVPPIPKAMGKGSQALHSLQDRRAHQSMAEA